MTFPNAFKGVKKIFTSELLGLIGGICAFITAILALVAVVSIGTESEGGFIAGGVGGAVFGVAAAVLVLIGYILKLVGMKQAGHDEDRFRQAFWIAICALVLNVVSSIFRSMNVGGGIADNIVDLFVKVASIFITVFIISGIQNLADKLGKPEIGDSGHKLLTVIVIVYILSMIVTLIPIFFGSNPATSTISGILGIVAVLLDIIAYIIFLVYLGKAKKMLKEN